MCGLRRVRNNYADKICCTRRLFLCLPTLPIPLVEINFEVCILWQRRLSRVFWSENTLEHLESALTGVVAVLIKFLQDFEFHGNPLK